MPARRMDRAHICDFDDPGRRADDLRPRRRPVQEERTAKGRQARSAAAEARVSRVAGREAATARVSRFVGRRGRAAAPEEPGGRFGRVVAATARVSRFLGRRGAAGLAGGDDVSGASFRRRALRPAVAGAPDVRAQVARVLRTGPVLRDEAPEADGHGSCQGHGQATRDQDPHGLRPRARRGVPRAGAPGRRRRLRDGGATTRTRTRRGQARGRREGVARQNRRRRQIGRRRRREGRRVVVAFSRGRPREGRAAGRPRGRVARPFVRIRGRGDAGLPRAAGRRPRAVVRGAQGRRRGLRALPHDHSARVHRRVQVCPRPTADDPVQDALPAGAAPARERF